MLRIRYSTDLAQCQSCICLGLCTRTLLKGGIGILGMSLSTLGPSLHTRLLWLTTIPRNLRNSLQLAPRTTSTKAAFAWQVDSAVYLQRFSICLVAGSYQSAVLVNNDCRLGFSGVDHKPLTMGSTQKRQAYVIEIILLSSMFMLSAE